MRTSALVACTAAPHSAFRAAAAKCVGELCRCAILPRASARFAFALVDVGRRVPVRGLEAVVRVAVPMLAAQSAVCAPRAAVRRARVRGREVLPVQAARAGASELVAALLEQLGTSALAFLGPRSRCGGRRGARTAPRLGHARSLLCGAAAGPDE